jgi:hypothetical protein
MESVHIVCGDSAAGSLKLAQVCDPEAILVQHDVLSCGPLQPFASLEEWRRVRQHFWLQMCEREVSCDGSHDLLDNAQKLRDAKGLVVWVGAGLSDQLLLPSTLRIAELAGAVQPALWTVEYTRVPGLRREVAGIGELAPHNFVEHPEPRLISEQGVAELRRIWTALSADDPGLLLEYLVERHVEFPVFRRSLRGMLARFPDLRTGLSDWDAELLRSSIKAGPDSSSIVAQTIISGRDWLDPVGDTFLFWRLRRLGDQKLARPPLLVRGELPPGRRFKVEVTSAAIEILAGRQNFVHLNGIDEWIAGVHLQSSLNRSWFRRGDELISKPQW